MFNKEYNKLQDNEKTEFRLWFLTLLDETNPVTVTFNKINGEERIMKCTNKYGVVPTVETKRLSDTHCIVWDVDQEDWRSFLFENVKKIEV